jgi:ribosomal protein L32
MTKRTCATRRSAIKLRNTEKYDIKKSALTIGKLYPVLKSADGKIIDGMHRKHVDKNWPEHIVNVSGHMATVARIVANVQRREVSPKEKTNMLRQLAEETHWTPEQIAEKTGMSISWVRKYLPYKYKNKEMGELAKKKHGKRRKLVRPANKCPNCGCTLIPVFICPECDYMVKERKIQVQEVK